jgi:hypothetical protein
MNIQEINKDIIAYLGQMIKDNDDYDIYNISEEEFDDIKDIYLNDWERRYDIITEYYGNTTIFIPSLEGFIDMMDLITIARQEYDDTTDWSIFMNSRNNNIHTYANTLRYYAYYYINNMGYVGFLKVLKEWIEDNISDDE